MDVSRWLAEQGLGRYAATFAESGVGADVLRDLTDADLKELRLNLGDRKRLLKAIAALNAAPTADPLERAEATTPVIPRDAERRQLTVMFVDLVGSTELAGRLDPEDMGALIRAYQSAVAGEITRFEGHIAKYMGDGVLAYFGWPRAHEDEAERAVRAGLAISSALAALEAPSGERLAARIGIATGPVVVGELIGEGAAQEQTVIGETPNLAARLQALAAPGSIVISSRTQRLVGGLFELADLGPQHLKGFAEPVPAFRVGEGRAESRFEARRGAGLIPLVGREQELALLLDRWELAKGGEGQVVLLGGEAGIGKSRITLALRERLREEPRTSLRYTCSPYHTNSALFPVIAQLERATNFARDDPPEVRLAKLKALLGEAGSDVREATALMAEFLGLPVEGQERCELTSEQRRARSFQTLLAQLEGLATKRPVLTVLEDAHWLDPTTLELFGLIVDRIQRLPVLLVVTHRPEFEPPWRGYPHVTTLTLNRLGRAHAQAMIGHLTGGRPVPVELVDPILAKTEGVPLFVEELTKTVLESGRVREDAGGWAFSGPLPLAIPATLQDSLMARLDRLGPVRDVAQIAACIGREFDHTLLAAVANLPAAQLADALAELVRAELVFCRGTPPDASYTFKHALVQDAAYQSLLKSRRRQLHARVAAALERVFPERAVGAAEVVAHHLTEAGLLERAVDRWRTAGRTAVGRSAFTEAVGHFTKGLQLLAELPDGETLALELDLQIALGPALIATRGFAAPEVGRAYRRARELCGLLGEHERRVPALWGSWVFHTVRAELAEANRLGYELLELTRSLGNRDLLLQAHHALETSLFWSGRLKEALQHTRLGLAIYAPDRHRGQAASFAGHDPGVCCLAIQALALWLSGHPDQAERSRAEAIALARRVQQPGSLAHAQQLSCRLHVLRRDPAAAFAEAEGLIDFALQHGFPHPLGVARIAQGWARAHAGDVEAGIAGLEEGLRTFEASGAALSRATHLGMFAEILGRAGRRSEAMALIDAALEHIERSEERIQEAELWRLKGELLGGSGPDRAREEAERCLGQALEVARRQEARSLELRAATSLARLWAEHGRRRDAHDLLAPIHSWFSEGFDTQDLKDAKALLDELA